MPTIKTVSRNTGVWCNGSIPVSKTVGVGSNPATPANNRMCPKLVSEGSHKAPHLPRWFESSHPDKKIYTKICLFGIVFVY